MAVDLVVYNEALTAAIRVLEASGNQRHAATLRTSTPELMRFARIGMAAHDAAGRDPKPTTEIIPQTDAITRNARNHA